MVAVEVSEMEEVGIQNTDTLLECVQEFPSIADFLHADIRIPIHAVQMPTRSGRVSWTLDVDGVVIELSRLSGLLLGVHYLNLPKLYTGGLTKMFPYIKKHIVLSQCSDDGIKALRNVLGHKLAGGFFLNLVCLPTDLTKPDSRLTRQELHGVMAAELLNEVIYNFRVLLKQLPSKEKSHNTVQKQSRLAKRYRLRRQDMCWSRPSPSRMPVISYVWCQC